MVFWFKNIVNLVGKWASMVSHFTLLLMNNLNNTEAAIFVTLGQRTEYVLIYSDYVSTDVVYLVLCGFIMLIELRHCVLNTFGH